MTCRVDMWAFLCAVMVLRRQKMTIPHPMSTQSVVVQPGIMQALLGDAAARMRTCFRLSTDCLPEPRPPWNFSFTNRKSAVHFSGMETDFIPRGIKTLAPTGTSTATRSTVYSTSVIADHLTGL